MIKIGENQVSNEEIFFKAIYDKSPIGFGLYDVKKKLIDTNQAYMELFGVNNKDDIKNINLFDILYILEVDLKKK